MSNVKTPVGSEKASRDQVLDRVMEEVRRAEMGVQEAATTAHMTYVSGVFEPAQDLATTNRVLDRVLAEIRESGASEADTTAHSSYVSGVFEQ